MTATGFGMLIFEDETPDSLTRSTFTEINDGHYAFKLRQTLARPERAVTMIFTGSSSATNPDVILEFGPSNTLGAISYPQLWPGHSFVMNEYIPKTSRNTFDRKFRASDKQLYTWRYLNSAESEWSCTNDRNYEVASYQIHNLLESEHKDRCSFCVDEGFTEIAIELLASLMIMRHTKKYNIRN